MARKKASKSKRYKKPQCAALDGKALDKVSGGGAGRTEICHGGDVYHPGSCFYGDANAIECNPGYQAGRVCQIGEAIK